jgi:hypothetical protein
VYGEFFDVSGFLAAIYTFEKVAVGLPVLALLFTVARVFLWALLSPALGRQAGLVASVLVYCAAFLLLAGGHGTAAVEWAAGVASRLLGVFPGTAVPGLPGLGSLWLGGLGRGIADALSSVVSALAPPGW